MAAGQKPIMRVSAKAKQGEARVNLVAIWARDDGRGYSAKLDRGVRITVEDGNPIEIDPNDYWINFTDFRELERARGGGGAPRQQGRPAPQQAAFDAPPPDDDDIPF